LPITSPDSEPVLFKSYILVTVSLIKENAVVVLRIGSDKLPTSDYLYYGVFVKNREESLLNEKNYEVFY
jgi:hypothetical protein